MHGGAAPQVQRKAEERFLASRDLSLEKFHHQLELGVVKPETTMAAARDFTKTLLELQDREAARKSESVILRWIKSLGPGQADS